MYQVVTRVINVNQLITSIIPPHHHIPPPPPPPHPARSRQYLSEKLRESPFYPTVQGVTRRCRLPWLTNCIWAQTRGDEGSMPNSCMCTWSPNNLWTMTSNSIFNLCYYLNLLFTPHTPLASTKFHCDQSLVLRFYNKLMYVFIYTFLPPDLAPFFVTVRVPFFLYISEWRKKTFVHLLSHWGLLYYSKHTELVHLHYMRGQKRLLKPNPD